MSIIIPFWTRPQRLPPICTAAVLQVAQVRKKSDESSHATSLHRPVDKIEKRHLSITRALSVPALLYHDRPKRLFTSRLSSPIPSTYRFPPIALDLSLVDRLAIVPEQDLFPGPERVSQGIGDLARLDGVVERDRDDCGRPTQHTITSDENDMSAPFLS